MPPSDASPFTTSANADVATGLRLDDPADLERVQRGRVAGLERLVVRRDNSSRTILDTDSGRS